MANQTDMPNSSSFLVMTGPGDMTCHRFFRSPTKTTTFLTVSSAAPCGCAGGFGKSTSRLPTENQIYNVRGSWELSLGNKKCPCPIWGSQHSSELVLVQLVARVAAAAAFAPLKGEVGRGQHE